MEASSLSQSSLLQSQFGQSSSSTLPPFNQIKTSLLDNYLGESNVSIETIENSKKFIQLVFKEVQAARTEILQNEENKITCPKKFHKLDFDHHLIKTFLKKYCNIEITFQRFTLRNSTGDYGHHIYNIGYDEVRIASEVKDPWFSSRAESMPKVEHLELFEEPTNLESAIKLYLVKSDENNRPQMSHLIREIFKKQQEARLEAERLGQGNFVITEIIPNKDQAKSVVYFFKTYLQMKVTSIFQKLEKYVEYSLSTDINNPYIQPRNLKPILTSSINETVLFKSPLFFNDVKYTDISLIIEGKEIKVHKAVLALTCPYFEAMFSGAWKAENSIPFEACSYETFMELKKFIYTESLNVAYLDNFDNCIDLLQLAHLLLNERLVSRINNALENENFLNEENFVHIAYQGALHNNSDLIKLCVWFANNNPLFGDEINLSDCPVEYLAILLQSVATNYRLPKLQEKIIEAYRDSIKLDQSFIKLCNAIVKTKGSLPKKILFEVFKEKNLKKTLEEGKENEFKDLWIPFIELCTAIDI